VELGIEEIYHPEEDTAGLVTSMLMIRNAINVLQINDNTLVVEIPVPKIYAGHTLEAVNMESRFDIKPVAVKIAPKDKGMAKLLKKDFAIDLECNRFRPLRDADRLIIIGNMENVKRFIE
jgi:trk system potassium uptake protein TrkA